jgi:hypothetical protein
VTTKPADSLIKGVCMCKKTCLVCYPPPLKPSIIAIRQSAGDLPRPALDIEAIRDELIRDYADLDGPELPVPAGSAVELGY